MKSVKFMVLALSVVAGVAAHAGVKDDVASIEAVQKTCLDSATSNMAMKQCVFEAYTSMDDLLNVTYKVIVAKLEAQIPIDRRNGLSDDQNSKEILRRLVASEVAWISYKEKQCQFEGTEMLGGTGEGLIVGSCLFNLTTERVLTIDRIAGFGQFR